MLVTPATRAGIQPPNPQCIHEEAQMRRGSGAQGRAVAPRRAGVWCTPAAVVLLIALAGCGSGKSASTGAPAQDHASTTVAGNTTDATSGTSASPPAGGSMAMAGSGSQHAMGHAMTKPMTHLVTLNDKVCVQFDPLWTRLRVGETVTWHSNLKKTVTIYVSPGVFARDHYVIHPGATVRTGAVRQQGDWAIWTEPAACHEAPRGVLAAGPGVFVEPTFFASAPGVGSMPTTK
jgi:hypothetical protein